MHKFTQPLLLALFSFASLYSFEEDQTPTIVAEIAVEEEVCAEEIPIVEEEASVDQIADEEEVRAEEIPVVENAEEASVDQIADEEEVCAEEIPVVENAEEASVDQIADEEEVCVEEIPAVEVTEEASVDQIVGGDEVCAEEISVTEITEVTAVAEPEAEIYEQSPIADELLIAEYLSPEFICEEVSLLDEEIEIELVGLKPNQMIDIEAQWIGDDRVRWSSTARFIATSEGIINLTKQAPITGTYQGIDPMGLFWSMEMGHVIIPEYQTARDVPEACEYSRPIHLLAFEEGVEIAEKTICRQILGREIELIELRENGLIGDLYIPQSQEPLPVVIVLTGSNGGIPSGLAALFASNDIAAFALAYSGVGDLPPIVENVPLEYFERAFEWLQHHPRLNGKIALHGTSRGAELALLLGARYPEVIDRIVAVAPSSVVLSRNSWIYKNEPVLPAAPFFIDVNYDYHDNFFAIRENAHSIRIHRERGIFLENDRFDAASIPVEKIQCPILLISGGDDQLGPCTFYAKHILKRLDEFHSKIERIHLDYPEAGHFISIPYLPRQCDFFENGSWYTVGGAPLADELASRDSWMRTLEFLKK